MLIVASSYANRAARFINMYAEGMDGAEASWASRKYHGHRSLPPEVIQKLKDEFQDYLRKKQTIT